MPNNFAAQERSSWRGLGLWNVYFIAKLMLYGAGYLNFHTFYNLVFAAVLLMPLPPLWLHRLRHIIAIPVGVALLYYDSWLPPFQRLLDQPEVLQFSGPYLLELLNRFINWNMLGAGLLLFVACLFLQQWVRVTVFSVTALLLVSLPDHLSVRHVAMYFAANPTAMDVQAQPTPAANGTDSDGVAASPKSITDILNDELAAFYAAEAERRTVFAPTSQAELDFDIIFLNICSVAWSDLASVQLDQHPLLKSMDVVFDEFNAATSYSGPAVRRLLRASCGQTSHEDLYDAAPSECYLFEHLNQSGFQTAALLNHNGQFQDFISDITQHESLPAPAVPQKLSPRWTAFDGSPIWGDYDALNDWWQAHTPSDGPRALLYNSITLHDGNREATADGGGRSSPYASRGQAVLDDLLRFIQQLENSGRRVLVVLIPEHGAALEGDLMQISGMREIPTPEIAHVPVGLKLIGHAASAGGEAGNGETAGAGEMGPAPYRISGPTSYLALSELLARILRTPVFDSPAIDWDALTNELPYTRAVSENSGTVIMEHNGVPYVRMGDRDWIQYRR